MFCTHCGTSLDNSANFCPNCGVAIKDGGRPYAQSPQSPNPPRPLFRLASDKKIAGVCSGVAYYLNMDITLFRVLFAAVTVATGIVPLLIAYAIAWAIMPLGEPVHRASSGQAPYTEPGNHPTSAEDSSTSATLVT